MPHEQGMFSFPMEDLRRQRRIGYYFRYPLERKDFRPLNLDGRALGDFSAKALYNDLNDRGEVDRQSGFSGDVAALFVPEGARSAAEAMVFLAQTDPARLVRANGTRNWPEILDTARDRILEFLREGDDARTTER